MKTNGGAGRASITPVGCNYHPARGESPSSLCAIAPPPSLYANNHTDILDAEDVAISSPSFSFQMLFYSHCVFFLEKKIHLKQ